MWIKLDDERYVNFETMEYVWDEHGKFDEEYIACLKRLDKNLWSTRPRTNHRINFNVKMNRISQAIEKAYQQWLLEKILLGEDDEQKGI